MASQRRQLLFVFLVVVATWLADCGATDAKRLPLLRGHRMSLGASESAEGSYNSGGCLFRTIAEQNPSYNKSDLWVGRQISAPRSKGLQVATPVWEEMVGVLCDGGNGLEAGSYMCVRSVEEMVQYAGSKLGSSDELEALQTSSTTTTSSSVASDEDVRMTITQVASKGSNYTSVVCHDVSSVGESLFVCGGAEEKVEIMKARVRWGEEGMNGSVVVQCGGGGEKCEWMSERSMVWVVMKEKEEEEEGSAAWANAKSTIAPRQSEKSRRVGRGAGSNHKHVFVVQHRHR